MPIVTPDPVAFALTGSTFPITLPGSFGGNVPTIRVADKLVTPAAANFALGGATFPITLPGTFGGNIPTILLGARVTPDPAVFSLGGAVFPFTLPGTFGGNAPNIIISVVGALRPDARAFTLTGFAPTVTGSTTGLQILGALFSLAGAAPRIIAGVRLTPAGSTRTLTGGVPTLRAGTRLTPAGSTRTLTGGIPTVRAGRRIYPEPCAFKLTGGAPPRVAPTPNLPVGREFAEIDQLLIQRRWAYLSRQVPQPLIRLWDKNMEIIARIEIPESWSCEEIAYDNGMARIEIVGKDNDWLREIVCFQTRPAEDLHITIDPDRDKPHDWKSRWGGKVETIEDEETKGKPTTTVINCISNRKHLSKILLAATPILPPAFQPLRMFLWGGPCVTTCATATMINLFRIYTLNAFWPIPRNIFSPLDWLLNINPLAWPVQVMPVNPIFDQSRWCTIGSRWKDAETVLTPVMKDCGVICHAYTWIPGDPPPYTEAFGKLLGSILQPFRPTVILSFEDASGVGGPTGTIIDGLINLFAATADDLITETLFPIDGDGDGETDPFIRKILGVAPKRPPFVYRDTGYGGVISKKMVIHKTQATIITVGGKSPAWVNMAITFSIRYAISQLAQVILGIEAPGVEGLDNLYQGQLDDTVLPFMNFMPPGRGSQVGLYGWNEHFQQGSGSAFTLNSIMDIRAGWYATKAYTSFKFDVGDGSPYKLGEDFGLGSRVTAERRGVLYTDQIMAIKRQGDRNSSGRPIISFGDDRREEDPVAQGMATIMNVASFAAQLAGSGDLF